MSEASVFFLVVAVSVIVALVLAVIVAVYIRIGGVVVLTMVLAVVVDMLMAVLEAPVMTLSCLCLAVWLALVVAQTVAVFGSGSWCLLKAFGGSVCNRTMAKHSSYCWWMLIALIGCWWLFLDFVAASGCP